MNVPEMQEVPKCKPPKNYLTDEDIKLIKGCLIAQSTMLTAFGTPSRESLELYRKLMNLNDRLEVGE